MDCYSSWLGNKITPT